MNKIPTLFQRSEDRRHVIDEVTPGCEWVLTDPQAIATRKYDGTCVMIDPNGQAWARREVKASKPAPPNFVLVEHDDATGKDFGWEPAEQSGFAKYIREATDASEYEPGTYELCGPKVQGNPEGYDRHQLIRHDLAEIIQPLPPLTFSGLRDWLQRTTYEGIVWHHPDGRMAKLKRRDFPRLA